MPLRVHLAGGTVDCRTSSACLPRSWGLKRSSCSRWPATPSTDCWRTAYLPGYGCLRLLSCYFVGREGGGTLFLRALPALFLVHHVLCVSTSCAVRALASGAAHRRRGTWWRPWKARRCPQRCSSFWWAPCSPCWTRLACGGWPLVCLTCLPAVERCPRAGSRSCLALRGAVTSAAGICGAPRPPLRAGAPPLAHR
jgi:hypothetical protein